MLLCYRAYVPRKFTERNGEAMKFGRLVIASAVTAAMLTGVGSREATAFMAPRIIGGGITDASTVPWTVALMNSATSDPYAAQFCGGSLVHVEWVLTAAHCVSGRTAASINVAWGKTKLSTYTAGDRKAIDQVVMNPQYLAGPTTSDIALLHLTVPATGATTIPWNTDPSFPVLNQSLSTYGWGNMSASGSQYPDDLHGVQLVDRSGPTGACGSYGSSYVSDHMLCAGVAAGGKDACDGDSGGPIVAYTPTPVLVGDTSWGNSCALAAFPGIWARMSSYADWVHQVINAELPELSIGNATVLEGDSGTRAMKFAVVLNAKSASTVTVPYSTSAGSATSGTDFTAKSGVLTFLPNAISKTISISVKGDAALEATESFTVNLGAPSATAVVADGVGTATIIDDDGSAALQLGIGDVAVPEGDNGAVVKAQFLVSLDHAPGATVTVNYATNIGSAGANDFTSKSGALTFTATQTSKVVTISIRREWIPEGDEVFTVQLSGASGAGVVTVRSTGTATIQSDD